jgi:hypothetical protein
MDERTLAEIEAEMNDPDAWGEPEDAPPPQPRSEPRCPVSNLPGCVIDHGPDDIARRDITEDGFVLCQTEPEAFQDADDPAGTLLVSAGRQPTAAGATLMSVSISMNNHHGCYLGIVEIDPATARRLAATLLRLADVAES